MMSLVKGQRNTLLISDLREGSELLQRAYREFLKNVDSGYCRVISFFETQDSRVIEVSPLLVNLVLDTDLILNC
jgi:hypothetical protein